ncbi:hypothetical protein EYF80_006351 [Liparis tanakae]|uniref:Uncharacterized protein n=1 Tax=Liparis tanakae TaxID=230148 RepID=A0A4Z2IZF7_9TELE|nr:hypothetical protein EYF80_006351 [Liparis tanakae]
MPLKWLTLCPPSQPSLQLPFGLLFCTLRQPSQPLKPACPTSRCSVSPTEVPPFPSPSRSVQLPGPPSPSRPTLVPRPVSAGPPVPFPSQPVPLPVPTSRSSILADSSSPSRPVLLSRLHPSRLQFPVSAAIPTSRFFFMLRQPSQPLKPAAGPTSRFFFFTLRQPSQPLKPDGPTSRCSVSPTEVPPFPSPSQPLPLPGRPVPRLGRSSCPFSIPAGSSSPSRPGRSTGKWDRPERRREDGRPRLKGGKEGRKAKRGEPAAGFFFSTNESCADTMTTKQNSTQLMNVVWMPSGSPGECSQAGLGSTALKRDVGRSVKPFSRWSLQLNEYRWTPSGPYGRVGSQVAKSRPGCPLR